MESGFDPLKLENQLCFPLYACAREVVKKYKPFLDEIGLTYTQYVTMMVLWEAQEITSREIGERLHLDSGTLTPLLRKLEDKGLVTRGRCSEDGRNLTVAITESGRALRGRAESIPSRVGGCIPLESGEARALYELLHALLERLG